MIPVYKEHCIDIWCVKIYDHSIQTSLYTYMECTNVLRSVCLGNTQYASSEMNDGRKSYKLLCLFCVCFQLQASAEELEQKLEEQKGEYELHMGRRDREHEEEDNLNTLLQTDIEKLRQER